MNILQAPSQLRELRIDSYGLSKIPKSIGQLKHLERMVVTSRSDSILEIPKEFCDLRSLKHLVLHITNLSSSLPDSFGNLSRLQHIDLSGCGHLERLPDSFGNLSMLEHIKLSGCGHLERLPDSFGNLSRLQHINLSYCYGLERLPYSFGNLSRLQHINLSHCYGLERLPDLFRNSSMLDLDIRECLNLVEVGTLPDALTNLQLTGCRKLRKIERLCGFPKFQTLDVSLCKEVEQLPLMEDKSGTLTELRRQRVLGDLDSSFDKYLFRLQHLKLYNTAISKVSFPTGVCPNLQRLDIRECLDLVEVGTLPDALTNLQLTGCRKLRKIERLCGSPKFQTLDVSLGKEVEQLPLMEEKTERRRQRALGDLDSSFDKYLLRLQHLELHNTGISEVSFPPGVCPNLQDLDIRECRNLVEVGTLSDALRNLQLIGCPKLRKVERLFGFGELQTLDVSGCEKVEELLSIEGKKETLTESRGQITFSHLDSLFRKCVPRLQLLEPFSREISEVSFPKGVYPNLQYLFIKHSISTVKIGKSPNGEFIKLEVLNCCNLRKIEELCGLAKLQILHISSCEGLERLDIWSGEGVDLSRMETLVSLQELQVVGCPNLKSIYGLAHPTHLRELNVSGCSKLQELSGLPHLTQLRELNVSGCSELQELPGLEHLTSLKKLWAYKCVKLKNIKGLEQLTQLRELDVSGCIELEEMPGVGYLQSLVELDVSNCVKLKSLWGLLRLSNLSILEHTGVPMRIFAFDSMS